MTTKAQTQAVSNLVSACTACGATFVTGKATYIEMPDSTRIHVEEADDNWHLHRAHHWIMPHKTLSASRLQIHILELYLKILKEKSLRDK